MRCNLGLVILYGGYKEVSAMSRSPRIDEIASMAGVSKTTISRFLNEKYEYMSGETRKRIEDIIKETGYRPNQIARTMKSKFSRTLGCVIADITNPVSSILVKGINDVCTRENYAVYFFNTDNKIELETQCVQTLIRQRVDGLLVNTCDYEGTYLNNLAGDNLPIVLTERCLKNNEGLDCVISESTQSTYTCVQHLAEQGYSKIGFFCSDIRKVSSRIMRYESFLKAASELLGYKGDMYTVSTDLEESKKSVMRFYKAYPTERKTIFCVNGVTLLNTLRALFEMNIPISRDFSICSFDDWGWPSMVGPGITTLAQDSYLVGVRAAELLINRIEGKIKGDSIFLEIPCRLIKRGSTLWPAEG